MIRFQNALEIVDVYSFIFLIVLIIEAIWDIAKKKRRKKESLSNMVIFIVNTLLDRTLFGLLFIYGLYFVKTYISWSIPVEWWTWIIVFILLDFTFYWMHRWEHEIRFLWAFHNVHHSSEEFNFTTAVRISWVSSLFEWVFFIPLVIMGFDVLQILVTITIINTIPAWVHTEKIGKLGWIDKVFVTPSNHRVHHGSNPQYLDKNYGGVFIIWDRIFGTYAEEKESVKYGLTKQIGTSNPFTINFIEYRNIIKDIRHSKNFNQVWKFVFGRTGWRPKEMEDKSKS